MYSDSPENFPNMEENARITFSEDAIKELRHR